jgi:hypothetical protein
MKIGAVSLIVLSLSLSAVIPAYARNVKLILPIAAAMEAEGIPDRPTGSVKFFFGNQKSPEILTKVGSHVATPRSGAIGISDERACYGALLWTLVALEKRAQQMGANAVVNIVSYYRKTEMASATEFECHVGNVIATVWLKGDLVKIADE